jgi:hypothetical protein
VRTIADGRRAGVRDGGPGGGNRRCPGRRACGDAHRTVAGRLARLIGAPRVTGREAQVREVITAMLPSWAKPRVDEPDSLVLTLGA